MLDAVRTHQTIWSTMFLVSPATVQDKRMGNGDAASRSFILGPFGTGRTSCPRLTSLMTTGGSLPLAMKSFARWLRVIGRYLNSLLQQTMFPFIQKILGFRKALSEALVKLPSR